MKRQQRILASFAAAAWVAVPSLSAGEDAASKEGAGRTLKSSPNIVYIYADDLGYGDLSCYGQDKLTTPNIDRLATEGLRFTDHYSSNTVCSPSRASLMLGQHAGVCYLRGNAGPVNSALDPDATTLPEVLKGAGYATGMFGKWGLGVTCAEKHHQNPLEHGFDEFYGWKSQTIAHTYYPATMVHNGREVPVGKGTYVHPLVMEKAREFIKRNAEARKPFFCYIPTAIPHAAMHAPRKLHQKWRKKLPRFDNRIGKYGAGGEPCPNVVNPVAGFAAMMEHLDNEVGALLDLLAKLDIDEHTLVMFSSDNGAHGEGGHDYTFWNSTGGLRGMKRDMHEGGIRAPMLARWPGTIPAGKTTGHISAQFDVLATLCDIIDRPAPKASTGISFLPTLLGKPQNQTQHKYLYFEFRQGRNQKLHSRALRMGQWKAFQKAGQPLQLFNLEKDPSEKNDLSTSNPEKAAELGKNMDQAHVPLPSR